MGRAGEKWAPTERGRRGYPRESLRLNGRRPWQPVRSVKSIHGMQVTSVSEARPDFRSGHRIEDEPLEMRLVVEHVVEGPCDHIE
jgi:hypothetical protein